MSKYIITTYGISAGCIYTSNKINYQPKNWIVKTYWDMLKFDTQNNSTENGKILSTIVFVLSPLTVPLITGGISTMYIFDKYS